MFRPEMQEAASKQLKKLRLYIPQAPVVNLTCKLRRTGRSPCISAPLSGYYIQIYWLKSRIYYGIKAVIDFCTHSLKSRGMRRIAGRLFVGL